MRLPEFPGLLEKGGVGCLLQEYPRMLCIRLELLGGYLVSFARFCALFVVVLWLVRRPLVVGARSLEFAP